MLAHPQGQQNGVTRTFFKLWHKRLRLCLSKFFGGLFPAEKHKKNMRRLSPEFRVGEIKRACPGISQATINRTLAQLRREGAIRCLRSGRDAVWAKG